MDVDDYFNGEYKRLIEMENQAFYILAVEDGIEIGMRQVREQREKEQRRIAQICLEGGLSLEKSAKHSKLPIGIVQEIAQQLGL